MELGGGRLCVAPWGTLFSSLIKVPVEVTLRRDQGDIELFRELLSQTRVIGFSDLMNESANYAELPLGDRIRSLAAEVDGLAEHKQVLFLRGSDAILGDDGNFKEWVSLLLGKIGQGTWPKMALISRRMLAPGRQHQYPHTVFLQVNSLSRDESKTLLVLLLKHRMTSIDEETLDVMIDAVNGHPHSIGVAAAFAAQTGSARIRANPREFFEAIGQRATQLLESVSFTASQEVLLALFREYEIFSVDDLIAVLPEEHQQDLGTDIAYLQDFGIIEAEVGHLRLAPYLMDAVSRRRFQKDPGEVLAAARTQMLKRLEEYGDSDIVKASTVDAAVLAALRSNTAELGPLLRRALLPSHLLRIAREMYDQRQFAKAANLAERAFQGHSKLSPEAQVEALRIASLSHIRAGEDELYEKNRAELANIGSTIAKRVMHFVAGFKARTEGKVDLAEKEFRHAYRLGGERNFHVLRQLAEILALREELQEAEKFARGALDTAPTNPYVIDILVRILIDVHRNDHRYLRTDAELTHLLEDLARWSKLERRSFYESRMAQLESALRNTRGSMEWADRAASATPGHPGVLLQLARVQLEQTKFFECEGTLDRVKKLVTGSQSRDRQYQGEYDKLVIRCKIDKGDFAGARAALRHAPSLPSSLQSILESQIDAAEAFAKR